MTDQTARLLIVGPQGSGKGTQGVRIADAFGVPAISTGDMFRAAVAAGSDLGNQVKALIEARKLGHSRKLELARRQVDELVYRLFAINDAEQLEIEAWLKRRYPTRSQP